MTDAELASAAASGDRAAFAEIYDRYADRIHDFCASMLRDRHEAADAMQDTFVRAAERLGQLRDPEKLRSWLFAVARHETLRRIKARQRAVPTEEVAEVPAPAEPLSRGAEQDDLRQIVWDAAAGLAERDRVVLDLHLRQGLEGAELGDAIGVSENNAWVLMHRIRERLERSLGALLVARKGADDCADLAKILEGWDGAFSPLIRKRVARHVDGCDLCGERKASMTNPLALLATVPLIPAPAEARQAVLDRVQMVSSVSEIGDWRADGFPPGMDVDDPTRSLLRRAALLVLLALLLGGGVAWLATGDSPVDWITGTGEPAKAVSTSTTTTEPPTTTTSSSTTTTTEATSSAGGGGGRRSRPTTTTTTTTPPPPTTTSTTLPPTTTTTTVPPTTTTTTTEVRQPGQAQTIN